MLWQAPIETLRSSQWVEPERLYWRLRQYARKQVIEHYKRF